jgi:polar amino acid transport system substrate-binding protein
MTIAHLVTLLRLPAAGAALGLLLVPAACRPASPAATPPAAVTAGPSGPATGPAGGLPRLVVGTSADYPPFSYRTADGGIDGFDPALLRELGRRMEKEVELRDMAFAGLLNAVQLGQVDAAIAAITITPDRQAIVDFTDVYFVSNDAVLAASDSAITTIDDPTALADQRLGVQSDSVYESWARSQLVDTGLMALANLFSYPNMDQAVADLKAQRLDVVMLDDLPAQSFVAQGGVKVVGEDFLKQGFGIAVRQGSSDLLTQLNAALTEMQVGGAIGALAEQYLQISADELVPPSEAEMAPAATPVAAPSCLDGLQWERDATDSGAPLTVAPGASFEVQWTVRNIGTCPWETTYELVYVSGSAPMQQMSQHTVRLDQPVPSGETLTLSINLVAPEQAGTYQGVWQMLNAQRVAFGDRLSAAITVPAATAAPTQTPAPDIVFTAEPTDIQAGQSVSFAWDAPGSKAVFFSQQGQNWYSFPVPQTDRRVVWPASTTSYQLHVVAPDNRTEVRTIQITVAAAPASAPVITQFSLSPSGQVPAGQCVGISWNVDGQVSTVRLLRNDSPLWENAPVSGNTTDCLQAAGTFTFVLEAAGPGGTSRASQTLVVGQGGSTPTAAAPAAPPVISSFAVAPTTISVGQCVLLSWSVQGDVSQVTISRNDATIIPFAPASGSSSDCPRQLGQSAYRIQAVNAANQSAVDSATISVVP